jgi:hypothetical protein
MGALLSKVISKVAEAGTRINLQPDSIGLRSATGNRKDIQRGSLTLGIAGALEA